MRVWPIEKTLVLNSNVDPGVIPLVQPVAQFPLTPYVNTNGRKGHFALLACRYCLLTSLPGGGTFRARLSVSPLATNLTDRIVASDQISNKLNDPRYLVPAPFSTDDLDTADNPALYANREVVFRSYDGNLYFFSGQSDANPHSWLLQLWVRPL
jgi:hypothetical protein